MANTLAPSRNIENKKISLLLGEMKRRKINCESKLKKIENRIKVLDSFQNLPMGQKTNLADFLKSKGLRMSDIFSPMGYYCSMDMVVSNDAENNKLTYHKGFENNKRAGFPTPKKEIVSQNDHRKVINSSLGMTWNPALNRYFPTTPFDSETFASADGSGDVGLDIMGGFSMNDLSKLNNRDENARKLTKNVRDFLVEEYDNVEGEYDTIIEATNKLYYGDDYSSAEGDEKNKEKLTNKEKRQERKGARKEFRQDKRACKDKLNSGEFSNLQYAQCVNKEKEEKKQEIDKNAGLGRKAFRIVQKVSPVTASVRAGALVITSMNGFGFATRLAPALLPDAEAQKTFKPESIENAKKGWIKIKRAWKNVGGNPDKLKETIIKAYKKKPKKINAESSEKEEHSNFIVSGGTTVLIMAGVSLVTSMVKSLTESQVDKDPYRKEKIPAEFEEALKSGALDEPPLDLNAPAVNEKGEWIDPKTGEKVNPLTGKKDDRIFGLNKYLAIGIGVAGVVALFYLFKKK
jgi:hypothetical protein